MNIRRILMLNGFQIYLPKKNSRLLWSDEPDTKSVAFIVVPYISVIGEKIKWL